MSSAGIPPAMNGSTFKLGKYDLEESEILSGEIPVLLTDDKINYLLGNFQKIFGDRVAKDGLKLWFNQYGSFLVACPRQSSSLSKSIVRDKHIPVAPTLNNSRARNSALTLNGLRERNGPKGLLRNKPVSSAPTLNICRERNNICASDGLREEKNGPKDLLKDKTVSAAPAVNVSRERNNICTSELLREKSNGPKNLLKDKPVQVAPAVNISSETNSTCTSDGLKEKKNGFKGFLKDKPVPAAPVVNNSRKRNNLCTSDELKEKNNRPKGLLRDKPVHVAPSVNVLRERKSACTSDGQKEKNKNGPKGLVRNYSVPAAPTVNVSRERKSGLPSAGLREKKIVPKSLVREKPVPLASTVNVSRKRINTFSSNGLREKKNGSKGSQREKPVPVAPIVNVCRERNSACTSDGLSEKNNIANSLNIWIETKPDSPKDVYQILKEFELPLEPMLSPLPESLLCLKESYCQPRNGLESDDEEAYMNQKEINPSPKKSKIVKMKKLKNLAEKVSEGKPYETLELLPCKHNSPSAGETEKCSTDGINSSSVQDDALNDSWVCCNTCQKWRLLPIDINPSLLPEKWICSMLSWLSGMNRCSVTENETTEAVRAMYKINQNRELKEESLTKVRPVKRKRQLIIDNDDADEHSEGQVFKALKPCSVEANSNVESKLDKSPSDSSEQCNFIGFPGKEQIPPEQMISDGKKRKINFEEVDQSNLGNRKKAKVTKKVTNISAPLECAPPSPRRNTSSKVVDAKSSAAGKKFSSGKNCKPAAASSSDRYGKLRRMILERKTQIEKGFTLLNERIPILGSQNSLRIQRGVNRPKFIENCGNQSIISAFEEATKLKDHADRMMAEGLEREGTSMSFDAALKFLQVASLLEPEVTENSHFVGATEHSITIYSDAAKIFGLCAEEYEKYGEMDAAALAYKCTEAACMRIVFIKHSTASASQQECKRFPCLMPTDDSASSPLSELDNMTSQCNYNASYCHQDIQSLLNAAHDMSHAMEASKKAVSVYNHMHDRISSVKRALNVSFHDIDGLLDLVRVSMDAITHPSSLHH